MLSELAASEQLEARFDEVARQHGISRRIPLSLPVAKLGPFPVDALPDKIRRMAEAVAEANRVPIELSALAILGINGALVGKKIQARWIKGCTTPNLFMIIVADSGSGKSNTARDLIAPLFAYQNLGSAEWRKGDLCTAIARSEQLQNEIKALAKRDQTDDGTREDWVTKRSELERQLQSVERSKHNPYVLVSEDVSQEKFVDLLDQVGGAILSYSSDAGRVIDNILGRIADTGRVDDSVYLKAYSREPIVVHRMSREVTVPEPCASLLWFTTPDKVENLTINRSLALGGFLARTTLVLVAVPDIEIGDRLPNPIPEDVAKEYAGYVNSILDLRFSESEAITVELSEEASGRLIEWHDAVVRKINLIPFQEIKAIARRWVEQTLKIALGFHIAWRGRDAWEWAIDDECVMQAVRIMEWISGRQLEGYSDKVREHEDRLRVQVLETLLRVKNYTHGTVITPMHLYRAEKGGREIFKGIGAANEAASYLMALVEQGLLTGPYSDDSKPGGTRIYFRMDQAQQKTIRLQCMQANSRLDSRRFV